MPKTSKRLLTSPSDWKAAVRQRLVDRNVTRYAFVRDCAAAGVCTVHTGECLLADDGTSTGQRVPSLAVAIEMARRAGYDVVLKPRRPERTTR
jgi:hypothetical protein